MVQLCGTFSENILILIFIQEVAAQTVEGVFSEWTHNEWLDVRCVQSGYWEYRKPPTSTPVTKAKCIGVDFNQMQQMNLKTKKTRKIRRVMLKDGEA